MARVTMKKLRELAERKGISVSELFMGKTKRQGIEIWMGDGSRPWVDTVADAYEVVAELPDPTPELAAAALRHRLREAYPVGIGRDDQGPILVVYSETGTRKPLNPHPPFKVLGFPVVISKAAKAIPAGASTGSKVKPSNSSQDSDAAENPDWAGNPT